MDQPRYLWIIINLAGLTKSFKASFIRLLKWDFRNEIIENEEKVETLVPSGIPETELNMRWKILLELLSILSSLDIVIHDPWPFVLNGHLDVVDGCWR